MIEDIATSNHITADFYVDDDIEDVACEIVDGKISK